MTRNQENSPELKSFHRRFNIDVDFSEVQRRFVNRVFNEIISSHLYEKGLRSVLSAFGEISVQAGFDNNRILEMMESDFLKCLQAIEAVYEWITEFVDPSVLTTGPFSSTVERILYQSEVDLGISWHEGRFFPSGAKELDEALVNQPLEWLRQKDYESVLAPYEKALNHLLYSKQKPELLSVVVTDLYESLEALAKIVTKKPNKDLSANREAFLIKIQASEAYKSILKEYISYANKFRHAVSEGLAKPELSYRETESFLYLTGLFIRMAITIEAN